MGDNTVWLIVAIIAVLIILGIIAAVMSSKRKDARRVEAADLRDTAQQQVHDVRQREAVAAQTEAQADQARAEAEAAQARARQLQDQAAQQRGQADDTRGSYEADLRRADKLDPDVRTDRDGNRLDDAGNPVPAGYDGGADHADDHGAHGRGGERDTMLTRDRDHDGLADRSEPHAQRDTVFDRDRDRDGLADDTERHAQRDTVFDRDRDRDGLADDTERHAQRDTVFDRDRDRDGFADNTENDATTIERLRRQADERRHREP